MTSADERTAYIRSMIHPTTRKAACQLDWGPISAILDPEDVLTTARDLMAAAAHAEMDVAFLNWCRTSLKVDTLTAGHMLRDIRGVRPSPAGKPALRIEACAGFHTGLPYVHIARGSMKGELSPDEARTMAGHWTHAVHAAQLDVRLGYVLGNYPQLTPGDIAQIFTDLQQVQR
ncbi:hypothetical protein [Streptomyces sp. bgisy027]|uniref:hypothetical protein n=1 Tax=Streptomyces sp. bgisy027 TaxID=3413770 RepID=UPI003D70851E